MSSPYRWGPRAEGVGGSPVSSGLGKSNLFLYDCSA
jgi:hypothetical protein